MENSISVICQYVRIEFRVKSCCRVRVGDTVTFKEDLSIRIRLSFADKNIVMGCTMLLKSTSDGCTVAITHHDKAFQIRKYQDSSKKM